jgi:hypothetical protein
MQSAGMSAWNQGTRPPGGSGGGAGNRVSPWHGGGSRVVNLNNNNISCPYIDLQIGNHLRSTHPSTIRSDQVILVPSLFGSDLNLTTFDELRKDVERMLQDKFRQKTWVLDRVRKASLLSSPVYNLSVPSRTRSEKGTNETGHEANVSDKEAISSTPDDAARGDVAEPAVAASSSPSSSSLSKYDATARAARRICQYFSIDPDSALVSVGVHCGKPAVRAREAHKYVALLQTQSFALSLSS